MKEINSEFDLIVVENSIAEIWDDKVRRNDIETIRSNAKVLDSLTVFCECTKEELLKALYSRYTEKSSGLIYFEKYGLEEKPTQRWYYKRKRFIKGKNRDIVTPDENIRKAQEWIKKSLGVVPISFKSTGWKKWDSAEKHVEPHRFNRYRVRIDIKNCYPNIDAERVYNTLVWTLMRPLEQWFPSLTKDEKILLIKCIVFLTIYENELPQGAPTSDVLVNIVLASVDKTIQRYLENQDAYYMPRYTRFKDDFLVSYPWNTTTFELFRLLKDYKQKFDFLFELREQTYPLEETENKIEELLKRKVKKRWRRKTWEPAPTPSTGEKLNLQFSYAFNPIRNNYHQERVEHISTIRSLLKQLLEKDLVLTNLQEANLFRSFLKSVEEKLLYFRDKHADDKELEGDDYQNSIYRKTFSAIGGLHHYIRKSAILPSWNNEGALLEEITKLLRNKKWIINPKKTDTWNPFKSNPREATGVAFNENGERVLPTKKRIEYEKMYKLLWEAPYEEEVWLERKRLYYQFIKHWRVDTNRIRSTIEWIYGRIKLIYWTRTPPRKLKRYYEALKKRRWEDRMGFVMLEDMIESSKISAYTPTERPERPFFFTSDNKRYGSDLSDAPFPVLEDEKWITESEKYTEYWEVIGTLY